MVQRNRPRERVSPGFHCTKKSSVGRVYLEPTSWPVPSWVVSSVGRPLHRHWRGHRLKSRIGLFFLILFFRPYFHYCSSSAHYFEDHFHSRLYPQFKYNTLYSRAFKSTMVDSTDCNVEAFKWVMDLVWLNHSSYSCSIWAILTNLER